MTQALAEGPTILITSDDPALGRKVSAEAGQLGLVVVDVPAAERASSSVALLRTHDAVAIIRISPGESELTVAPEGRDTVTRSVPRGEGDAETHALKIVELLHGDLVELDLLPPPERKERRTERREDPPPPERVEATRASAPIMAAERDHGGQRDETRVPASGQRLWLNAGLAAIGASGGMGPELHGALGVALEPTPRWRIGADVLLPITELQWQAQGSTGEGTATLILGRASYIAWSNESVAIDAGAGAGVARLALSGETSPPLEGRDDQLFAAVAFAHAGLGWTALPWLRVRGSAFGGLSAPRPVARFEGGETAAWGRFVGGAAITGEFGLALSGAGG